MREGIIIGEGVVVDARPASFATRAVGFAIDLIALGLLTFAGVVVLGQVDTLSDYALAIIGIVSVVLLLVVIPTAVETLSRGASLGKLVMGIRIVRDDGGPVRLRHALVRSLVGLGEIWLTGGSVALIVSLAHPSGKRVGDLLAGTHAVRTRGGAVDNATVAMPPELAGWAAQADIRRLPDGLALAVRQFLGRAPRLAAQSRARLGMSLAAEVEELVAPGPPSGTHPEAFLMAVLAARRDREWAAAQRARALAREQEEMIHRLPYGVPDPLS
ncbi:putative RDD family membrane protein YckC [Flavimobilis soli]|uniref:Putative RDD family membrane protein YckC n=1 Tax=Flavimobilis soli TaxID=442709 RepID=A0A2A9EGG7_9MICO|nr:RDD family protein [Flavimobilis soli]PFG37621.1 putative RDD family membrane protein YckC [Flavimobilis soli]